MAVSLAINAVLFIAQLNPAVPFFIKNFFYGGIIALFLTFFQFKKQNLWVLYYNLGLGPYALLLVSFFLFETISIATLFIINSVLTTG